VSKVIALANQKGGTGKTTTTVNLGISLVIQGKKVLLVDADAQGNLTDSLGYQEPDNLPVSLATILTKIMMEEPYKADEGILHHEEGVDLMPGNIELSAIEVSPVNTMGRETVLRTYINTVKDKYDYVLIDCMPSLGMLIINALAAADSVIIPVQAHYLPAKGMTQLLQTIARVRKQINPKLTIDGVLLTMVDNRTNFAKEVEPYEDNMLKITNDGRKLALDQRLANPILPDHEESKVNACVENVFRIWQENSDDKLTQPYWKPASR
jgi:chromosome partitioning protein